MEGDLSKQISPELMAAIQKLVDQRVEEKMAQYEEVMKKMKTSIATMIKPGALLGRNTQSEAKGGAKASDKEETKDD
jgi:hypothetical protein